MQAPRVGASPPATFARSCTSGTAIYYSTLRVHHLADSLTLDGWRPEACVYANRLHLLRAITLRQIQHERTVGSFF